MEVEDNGVLKVDWCCRLQRSPLKKLPYTIPPYTTRFFAGGRAALHDVVDEAPAPAPAEFPVHTISSKGEPRDAS